MLDQGIHALATNLPVRLHWQLKDIFCLVWLFMCKLRTGWSEVVPSASLPLLQYSIKGWMLAVFTATNRWHVGPFCEFKLLKGELATNPPSWVGARRSSYSYILRNAILSDSWICKVCWVTIVLLFVTLATHHQTCHSYCICIIIRAVQQHLSPVSSTDSRICWQARSRTPRMNRTRQRPHALQPRISH